VRETEVKRLLYLAVKGNDRGALGQLLTNLTRKALWLAKSASRTDEDAEDAVQKAFGAVIARIDKFELRSARPEKDFEDWVLRRVIGEALNTHRRKRPVPEAVVGRTLEATSSDAGPFDTAAARDAIDRVLSQLPKLTSLERQAVELFLRGYEASEVAELQDIEPGVHSQRLHRALKRLRKLTAEADEEAL